MTVSTIPITQVDGDQQTSVCNTSDLNNLVQALFSFHQHPDPYHCFLPLSSQMLKSQVLGNISNNHYVYVGGLPSWYLAKLKVSHLIFRLPRIFSKCLRLLCFDFRDCCRELYFYSINLLLTLDPHAMPRWKLHLLTEWRSVAIFNILAKTKVCDQGWGVESSIRRI